MDLRQVVWLVVYIVLIGMGLVVFAGRSWAPHVPNIPDEPDEQVAPVEEDELTGKKAKKRAMKQARKQRKEYLEKLKEKKQEREQEYIDSLQERRDAWDEKERMDREVVKKEREERRVREDAEYEQWRSSIDVVSTGIEHIQVVGDYLLSDFVNHIRDSRCITIEELSDDFDLTPARCIELIDELEQTGQLSGVLDTSGRYIYLSVGDVSNLRAWVLSMGRVSLSELQAYLNSMLN